MQRKFDENIYHNALLHKRGRGLMGFERTVVDDESSATTTVTHYRIEPTEFVMTPTRQTVTVNGRLIEETEMSDSQIIQGLVYGSITIEYKGNGLFKIHPDIYDFDWHSNPNNSSKVWIRNIVTVGAHLIHGSGTPFNINFRGFYIYKSPIAR